MTIIDLSQYRNPGNGALEALRKYFDDSEYAMFLEDADFMPQADHLLAWLWSEGFKVVPLKGEDE